MCLLYKKNQNFTLFQTHFQAFVDGLEIGSPVSNVRTDISNLVSFQLPAFNETIEARGKVYLVNIIS